MTHFRFNLRQLLIGIVACAVLLVVGRQALYSQGLAVWLIVFLIGAALLMVALTAVYLFLVGFGALYGFAKEARTSIRGPGEPSRSS